jgi:flavin reductase (DIM6/NTAB) family NADH-FMN oxidoreductase RutF
MIPGAIAQMELEVFQRIPSGDHDIFVGRMLRAVATDGDPLLYYAGQYREIG